MSFHSRSIKFKLLEAWHKGVDSYFDFAETIFKLGGINGISAVLVIRRYKNLKLLFVGFFRGKNPQNVLNAV